MITLPNAGPSWFQSSRYGPCDTVIVSRPPDVRNWTLLPSRRPGATIPSGDNKSWVCALNLRCRSRSPLPRYKKRAPRNAKKHLSGLLCSSLLIFTIPSTRPHLVVQNLGVALYTLPCFPSLLNKSGAFQPRPFIILISPQSSNSSSQSLPYNSWLPLLSPSLSACTFLSVCLSSLLPYRLSIL